MNSNRARSAASITAVLAIVLVTRSTALGASGVWTESTGDGAWSSGANWSGGVVADGADNTADFGQVDVDAAAVSVAFPGFYRNAVQVDTPRTIGNLVFGDSNAATPGGWEVYAPAGSEATNLLTLAGASPTITVHPLGPIDTATLGAASPEIIDDARISTARLAGTSGFTKAGAGTLTIASSSATLTGAININEGTLRAAPGAALDFETAVTPAVVSFNLAAGTKLESIINVNNITAANGTIINSSGGGVGPAGSGATTQTGVNIAAGSSVTVNFSAAGTTSLGGISGTGATATINGSGGLIRLDRDWNVNGDMAVVNLNGTNPDGVTKTSFQIRPNGGAWDGNSLANTTVNLYNAILNTNQSTGGNTLSIGALNGTATAELIASGGGVGATTYIIGNTNTNASYAGSIGLNAGAAERSLNIVKVGSGVQELSGSLTYTPGAEASNINRRGGITRIEAGTLKLTGAASLPAGKTDATLGDLYSTVAIFPGATLDVSGSTATYTSALLQQTIGSGTIVGNYNHAAGVLAPANTNVGGNTATLTPVAGTITFNGNLELSGGEVRFDLSPSAASGNDLIDVTGATALTGGVFKPNYLSGAPAAGTVYTLVHSAGGFSGSASNLLVDIQGRGSDVAPSVVGNDLKFTVPVAPPLANLVWRGNDATNPTLWDLETTQNWLNTGTVATDKFYNTDNVRFDDTATGKTVSIVGALAPTSVVVDSTSDYTIGGTGRISGSATLTKTGSGKLTITTANDHVGGTTIAGGILNREATGGLGSGTLTLAGGELQSRAGTFTGPTVVSTGTTNQLRTLGGVDAADPNGATTVAINMDGAMSGSGALEFHNDTMFQPDPVNAPGSYAPRVQAIDVRANNSGFTGSVSFEGAGPIALRLTVAGAEGTNAAWDLGSNGTSVGVLFGVTTPTTVKLGSLSGGAPSPLSAITNLQGRNSGAGISPVVYEIGSLNTDTTFEGNILSGRIDGPRPENTTSLTKVGTGKLTLTGMDSALVPTNYTLYQGDTRIQGGTLSINKAYLEDAADVFISSGATLDLNFAGNDTIDALYLNGVPQAPGLYGAGGLGSSFFLGTGLLQVTTLGPTLGVIGDYNSNGIVDAADYSLWRDALGSATALANRDPANTGNVSDADYNSWKAHFGQTPGSGSLASSGAVPEPTSMALLAIMAVGLGVFSRLSRF